MPRIKVLIGPWHHYNGGTDATVSIFYDLDLVHHVIIDRDTYKFVVGHLIDLIYDGLVQCMPASAGIGTNHYSLIERD